jgi:TonB family protein
VNYPRESRVRGEEGICVVRIEADSDGLVRATQLVSTSGFDQLDEACLASFRRARVRPATLDGKAVSIWGNVPIAWNLTPQKHFRSQRVNDDQITLPIIQKHYELKVGPSNYPTAAKTMHQHGDCTVHVSVSENGAASNANLTKSTGFEMLDQTCVSAVREAPFIPAHADGRPVAGFADINISW